MQHYTIPSPSDYFNLCTYTIFSNTIKKQSLFAFDYSYLAIYFGEDAFLYYDKEKIALPKMYIHPARDCNIYMDVPAESQLILLRLSPTGFFELTGKDAYQNRNTMLDLSEILPSQVLEELYQELKGIETIEEINQKLTSFFDANISKTFQVPLSISNIIEQIHQQPSLSLETIYEQYPNSISTLNRAFKKYVGITAGLYLRLVKFNRLIRVLHNPTTSINDIIYQYNFYDQSHFIRDFKRFTDTTPKDYQNANYELLHKALGIKS